MDPAPRTLPELLRDDELGVPVPFACTSARVLDGRRVTQCALSRVCGVCGATLGRPVAFLGTPDEVQRNAFHFPPTHLACAREIVRAYRGVRGPALGSREADPAWVGVQTASFEFVRPGREDEDRRPTFRPSAILSDSL